MKSEKISVDGCALDLSYFLIFTLFLSSFDFWKKDKNTKPKLHIADGSTFAFCRFDKMNNFV